MSAACALPLITSIGDVICEFISELVTGAADLGAERGIEGKFKLSSIHKYVVGFIGAGGALPPTSPGSTTRR